MNFSANIQKKGQHIKTPPTKQDVPLLFAKIKSINSMLYSVKTLSITGSPTKS